MVKKCSWGRELKGHGSEVSWNIGTNAGVISVQERVLAMRRANTE